MRRLLLLDYPQETKFFTFVGVFGLVLAAIYWFLTYELAGTVLLVGFGLGASIIGIALIRARPPVRTQPERDEGGIHLPDDPEELESSAGGTGGIDTPFEDESGRLPEATLAPLSLGLGMALALTAIVFGPWLLVAGMLPIAWGAWTWASGARAELDATVASEAGNDAPGGVRDL